MRMRSKPAAYSPLPFHAVRSISAFSTIIVIGILAFFCRQLVTDGFKIPWTFIITLLAALLTIVALVFTSIITCCASLSPIFNIIINIPILIVWIVGFSLLTWNMYGALGHSCTLTNWGNDRGVMVCQVYKTLYSFVLFAALAQIAQIVVDVRARHAQLRHGRYDKMGGSQDAKGEDLKPLASTVHDTPLASQTSLQTQYHDDSSLQQPYHEPAQTYRQEFRDESPGWRPAREPAVPQTESYASSVSGFSSRHDDRHYGGYDNSISMQMQDFSYQRPQQAPQYSPNEYHSSGGYGHQQGSYYQSRY